MAPRLLLIAGKSSYNAADFVAAADKLEVEVQMASDRCHVLAEVWPEGAWSIELRDPAAAAQTIVERCADRPVDGIVATDEVSAEVAARAARDLGMAHNSVQSTLRAGDKLLLREALAEAGVPQPWFRTLAIDANVSAVATQLSYPVVIKPRHLSASRGVMRADDAATFAARVESLRRLLGDPEVVAKRPEAAGSVLIESFVAGSEHAYEGLLREGELLELALFDKPGMSDGPFFPETIYVTPSRLPDADQRAIAAVVAEAAAALGLRDGPVHAELRLAQEGPRVLELAARSIGGLCGRALRFGAGISLEELIITHAIGGDLGVVKRSGAAASGAMMLPVPAAGVLRAIEGVERARAVDGIVDVVITARVGETVVPLPEGNTYMGFVFGRGDDPAAVEAAFHQAAEAIRFRIVPRL